MTVRITAGCGLQVFGNSFAAGGNAPVGQSYGDRIAGFIGGSVENRAIGGTGVKSITQQGYAYHPYGARTRLVTWDGPLNDIRRAGPAALPAIRPALEAFLVSAFAGIARPASYPQVVKTGMWSALGSNHGGKAFTFNATPMVTQDVLATLSLTFTGDRIAITAFATENKNGNSLYRNLAVHIDGCQVETMEICGKAIPGEIACGAAKVYRGLGSGTHTIEVRPTQALEYSVVDCFVVPMSEGFAPVIVSHIPYIQNWEQYDAILSNDPSSSVYGRAIADQANQIISEVVAEWKADGFPVAVMPANEFYDPERDSDTDGIHPTRDGHLNLSAGYISQIRF